MAYRGQRLLCGLIRLYQRRCSGRGPLRKVVCTFHRSESCSAYGLRVAGAAASLGEALRLIRGRLRRCGAASLYRGRGGILWGELYDDVAFGASGAGRRLRAELEQAREAPATMALVLGGAARVAAQVGRGRLRGGLPSPPIRDGRRLLPSLRLRLVRRLGVLGAPPLLCAARWPWLALGLALLLLPLLVAALLRHRNRAARFQAIEAGLQFQAVPHRLGAVLLPKSPLGGTQDPCSPYPNPLPHPPQTPTAPLGIPARGS